MSRFQRANGPRDSRRHPTTSSGIESPVHRATGCLFFGSVHRGPADATFAPSGYQRSVIEEAGDGNVSSRLGASESPANEVTMVEGDGWTSAKFEATVTFDEPGTYTLRAVASDAMLSTPANLVITVTE